MSRKDPERELVEDIAGFTHDPLGYVLYAFPWGKAGTELARHAGPRQWQRETLEQIGQALQDGASVQEAIQIATSSGHGIGKSALVSMVCMWAMSTHEDTRSVCTANTEGQLRTKTWPELAKWHRMAINGHWFEFTASALYSKQPGHDKTWRLDAIPWSETNTEAFAGLHNEGKRILLVFDEASAIADKIWEVAEGALTDEGTEIIWLAFGNPTRNTGRFADCFGRLKHRWIHRQIDSRTVEGTNKAQLAKWVADYGEDSDFVRVRVRGVFPRASLLQFIPRDEVDMAMQREMPTIPNRLGRVASVGVDVGRFGGDQSVIRTRMGRDARSVPAKKFRGLDTMQLAAQVARHADELQSLGIRAVTFVDGGGVGGGVVDRLRQLGYDVIEVQFGAAATDQRKYANKRTEMYGLCREWLPIGFLDDDADLANELAAVEYGFTNADQLKLEKKVDMMARLGYSPDDADALVLTFAHPVPEWDTAGSSSARPPGSNRHRDDAPY